MWKTQMPSRNGAVTRSLRDGAVARRRYPQRGHKLEHLMRLGALVEEIIDTELLGLLPVRLGAVVRVHDPNGLPAGSLRGDRPQHVESGAAPERYIEDDDVRTKRTDFADGHCRIV